LGWTAEGGPPPGISKAIIIAAPHTSNWDFFYALLAGWSFGVTFAWLGKAQLFKSPLGWLFRLLGGMPVERSAAHGLVQEVGRRFQQTESLLLMVPAEGTRSYRKYWKSGFYFMAKEAQVPILLGYLDFGKKRAGMGVALTPSGDLRADMDKIRAFYADKDGKFPEKKSDIRLELEDRADSQETLPSSAE